MKAQPTFITPVNRRDVLASKSYFDASDIKRIGLSPFQSLGSISGMRKPQKSHITRRKYANNVTPLQVASAKTGLVIDKRNVVAERAAVVATAIAAMGTNVAGHARASVNTMKANIANVYEDFKTQPRAALLVLPLLIGGIASYALLSAFATDNNGTTATSSQDLSRGMFNASSEEDKPLFGTKKDTNGQSDTTATSASSNSTGSWSAETPTSSQDSGTVNTNVPAGGATDILPGGIPGVTEPVTTTLPGTNTTIDEKPALITEPIDVTIN